MSSSVTVLQHKEQKTDKTSKTDQVSNEEFLQKIFGKIEDDYLPVVVSFTGHPGKVPGSSWAGSPWHKETNSKKVLSTQANNYFSLAVFRPDEAGRYKRRKARFHALYAVMLDDIGGKIPQERLTLPPSWLLETSQDNYQAGYILSQPLTDGLSADRLMNAIVAAHLCDPGANGPRARLARLPVAVNGKHSPPFPCRLDSWQPNLQYSTEELVHGLELELTPTGRPCKQQSKTGRNHGADSEQVLIPRPEKNAVLSSLHDRDLYKAPLGEGKHDITCPWVNEHTDTFDSGTAYFEPDDNWPIGGFKCLHGHCSHRHIRELLDFLGVEINQARMKPTIRVVAGEIHRIVDAAERELAQSRRYYQRGGLIVTVVSDPGTRETRIQEINSPSLVRALAGVATWEKYDARSNDWVRTDPPGRHASVLFDSVSYPHLPVLNGLARQPYLRSDGSLMELSGYDQASGMFGVFDNQDFSIVSKPSWSDARSALDLLKNLLKEFSFATETDQAAALSAILTAVVRPSLSHAPMFHVRAHMVGSGKSYLCEFITAFATPQRGTPTTFPKDDEECRKLLLAELLRAPAVIEFDNLTGDLVAHKSLCMVLTSEFLSGRILGVSKTATVSTRTLFLSSGNNVAPVQDMTRRCISICLAPQCEIPAARTFTRPDLVRDVLHERGRYVSAVLTIILAWIAAGRPKTPCRSLASYGEWSDFCRQPLLWLGCADPTASIFDSIAEDPDREILARLLRVWHEKFDSTPVMVREVVSQSAQYSGHDVLRDILDDIAGERGEINRRKLGWWIKRHTGRIVDGLHFSRARGSRSAGAWRVEVVKSVPPVLPVSNQAVEKCVGDTKTQIKAGDSKQLSLFG